VIIIFDWLGDIISGMGDAIGNAFTGISDSIIDAILNRFIQWLFKSIYDGIANFFTQISNMGTEIFDLSWVQAVVKLFSLFGWSLFVVGVVVSAFDLAIEYQTGRANIKTTALNWIKGFMAVSLFTITPIELYKFCVSLQNTFAKDLVTIAAGEQYVSLGSLATKVLVSSFNPGGAMISAGLFELVTLIALGFCVFKIFFDNIKRGGILLIQLAVGSLYMFSIPRGYGDGFNNWTKQVFALCLTAFLQTTLLFLGLLSWSTNMLLAIGIMMSAAEVPRIAQQFGLDTSVKVNVMSAVHMGTSAVNLVKAVGK
jgi:large-conductance mechanosensitive channel